MGFYTKNILKVEGYIGQLRFYDSFRTEEFDSIREITFGELYPVPEEIFFNDNDDYEKTHKWCEENWGMNYDYKVTLCEKIIIEDETITYVFFMERPPILWIDYVSQMFPNLKFNLKYEKLITDSQGNEEYVECSKDWN